MDSLNSIYNQQLRGGENIYTPYIIVHETDSTVQLTVSRARKMLFFFGAKLLPLFLLCMVPVVLSVSGGGMPAWVFLLMACMAIAVALMLFFTRLIHNVIITDTLVEIISKRGFRKRTDTLLIKEVNHIYLRVVYGRGGGAFFMLCNEDGTKKTEFISIPILYMKRKNTRLICNRLKEITGLEIKGNIFGRSVIEEALN